MMWVVAAVAFTALFLSITTMREVRELTAANMRLVQARLLVRPHLLVDWRAERSDSGAFCVRNVGICTAEAAWISGSRPETAIIAACQAPRAVKPGECLGFTLVQAEGFVDPEAVVVEWRDGRQVVPLFVSDIEEPTDE